MSPLIKDFFPEFFTYLPFIPPFLLPYPHADVKRAFKTACMKAEIKDFHFHDLRHTFASHLVMDNTGLAVVRELLEYKDIKMTMRYSHLSSEHKVNQSQLLKIIYFLKNKNKRPLRLR